MRTYSFALTFFALLAGCGGNVVVGSSAGGGTSTATGGAGGQPTTTTTDGQGGAVAICGGKQGYVCPGNTWCRYPSGSQCGCCDQTGTCEPKPLDCPLDCPGVCGCDGQKYCNECLANMAGVDIVPGDGCATSPPPYSLTMIPGSNDTTFMIFRADESTCTRVTVSSAGLPAPYGATVTDPFHLAAVIITNSKWDCSFAQDGTPVSVAGDAVVAATVEGAIKIDGGTLPCGADANLTITFPAGGSWVPAQIPFVSGYLSTTIPCDP